MQVLVPLLAGLCCQLVVGGMWGSLLSCYATGAGPLAGWVVLPTVAATGAASRLFVLLASLWPCFVANSWCCEGQPPVP